MQINGHKIGGGPLRSGDRLKTPVQRRHAGCNVTIEVSAACVAREIVHRSGFCWAISIRRVTLLQPGRAKGNQPGVAPGVTAG